MMHLECSLSPADLVERTAEWREEAKREKEQQHVNHVEEMEVNSDTEKNQQIKPEDKSKCLSSRPFEGPHLVVYHIHSSH